MKVEHIMSEAHDESSPDKKKGRTLTRLVVVILGLTGIALNVNQLFNFKFFLDITLLDTTYYYILIGVFLSASFLIFPVKLNANHPFLPALNWGLAVLSLAISLWFASRGSKIITEGWEITAEGLPTILAALFIVIILEALRRTGGLLLMLICSIFTVYPLFAENLPGFLWGPTSSLVEVINMNVFGVESIIGMPMRVVAGLLIGFLIFGSALVVTGGGNFFMDLSTALLGKTRGGPAKVAIVSSGLFGSLSGSVLSNVVTTGQLTVPTMMRTGYPSRYAAAVEACASTGGALMPPIMGTVAFIMAEYLNVSYATVVTAAIVPALLFYLALILQADLYAARAGLKGLDDIDIPSLKETMSNGWHYLLSILLLVYLLVFTGLEAHAPFYATILLVITSLVKSSNGFSASKLFDLIEDSARNISNIVAILGGIGLIVGSLSYTGVGGAFSRELLQFAGDSLALLLFFGALTSFILGMGMTVSACYVFLAVVLGPALTEFGLDPIASHLFILYWGMLSYITPPVALAAVAASTISKSDPIKTGFLSMRLGLVNFILPFLFVMSPTLILRGQTLDIIHDLITAIIAVWLASATFEGWMHGVGRIRVGSRLCIGFSAICFLVPGVLTDIVGASVFILIYVLSSFSKNKSIVSY